MFENGYIKLHRSLLSWEWYDDVNVKVLFLHLLLIVNIKSQRKHGIEIPAGAIDRTQEQLCNELNLTPQKLRTAIKKLKSSGELTVEKMPEFSIYTVVSWSKFQTTNSRLTEDQQQTNSRLTTSQQQTNNLNKNNKEYKENKEEKEKGSSIEQEEYHHEWDDLPCLTWEEAKKWELENGRRWDGLIE